MHALLVDQQAALFGQACFQPGEMKCSFGTGSFLLMNIGREMRLSNYGLLTTIAWNWEGETSYALDGGIFVTGAAVQWLTESLGFLPDPAASAESACAIKGRRCGCGPSSAGTGRPALALGCAVLIFGLSRGSLPADIVRGTLEGIAFRVLYEVVNAMSQDAGQAPPHLKVDGGPSGNPYLMQYIADLLNIEVRVAAAREATAMGIANLAAHSALGISLEDLASCWQSEAVYSPQIGEEERTRRLAKWNKALEAVKYYHREPAS